MASSGSEVRPVIGLTTYRQRAQTGVWDVQASFLPAVYIDAVTKAGGIAVLLPPQDPVDARDRRRRSSTGSTGSSSREAATSRPSATARSGTRRPIR